MTWRSGGSRNALVHRLFTLGRSISMRDFSLGLYISRWIVDCEEAAGLLETLSTWRMLMTGN